MKVLELFAGTRSIGRAFESRGHKVYSVEWDKRFDGIDLYENILNIQADDIVRLFGQPDVIWASPDCTTYSIAAISHHREKEASGNLAPVSDYAKFCDKVNQHILCLIRELSPKYWFIENPRGGLRKMNFMRGLPRYTVTYCQYGDTRMKPTDIWTNHPNPRFKLPCHNGSPCHARAPRGAKSGTQGLKGAIDRAKIPVQLCEHIVDICEEAETCGARMYCSVQATADYIAKLEESLTAYERTGLKPEEIKKAYSVMVSAFNLAVNSGTEMLVGRLKEIIRAEAEGRLIVLPCKVGDTVYWNTGLDILGTRVADFIIDGAMQLRLNLPTLDITPVYPHDRLYLTREEAEAALRKEADNG